MRFSNLIRYVGRNVKKRVAFFPRLPGPLGHNMKWLGRRRFHAPQSHHGPEGNALTPESLLIARLAEAGATIFTGIPKVSAAVVVCSSEAYAIPGADTQGSKRPEFLKVLRV